MRIDMIQDTGWTLEEKAASDKIQVLDKIKEVEDIQVRAILSKILAEEARLGIGTKNVLAFGYDKDKKLFIVKEFPLEAQSDVVYPLHKDETGIYIMTEEAIVVSERILHEAIKSMETNGYGEETFANH